MNSATQGLREWSALTADEVGAAAESGCVAVLPVGATEQHGPHLATGTDWLLAEHCAKRACAQTGDILLPPLTYGCSLGHTARWPGTLSLSVATLIATVQDIGNWLHLGGFRRLVLVNGHGTNAAPCQAALQQLRFDVPDLLAVFVSLHQLSDEIAARYSVDGEDIHANATETSLVQAIRPELAHPERAVDEIDRTIGRVFPYAMPAVTVSGVVGEPTRASVQSGVETEALIVEALVSLLTRAGTEKVEF